MVSTWLNRDIFDINVGHKIYKANYNNTVLPRAYALIKVHKQNFPIRIIVSAINNLTYNLDKRFSLLFNKFITRPSAIIINSITIKHCLDKTVIPADHSLISLDVVSLFSNLPKDLILQAVSSKWNYFRPHILLSKNEFLEGITHLIDLTFLQFNGKFYKQIMGAPIGFCTSPWFAEMSLELLKLHCLNKLKNR